MSRQQKRNGTKQNYIPHCYLLLLQEFDNLNEPRIVLKIYMFQQTEHLPLDLVVLPKHPHQRVNQFYHLFSN